MAEKKCSFCGKPQSEAKVLIAGPDDIHICDDCIQQCNLLVKEELNSEEEFQKELDRLPTPEEIKKKNLTSM